MKVGAFFKLIRWKNLALLLYVFLLLKLVFFPSRNIQTNLTAFQFSLLCFSILCITAAGYIVNDIFDIKSDVINKPKKVIVSNQFSIEKAKQLYKTINSFGIITATVLALNLQRPSYIFIFIGSALLLYFYSKKIKAMPFIGNVLVSFLIAFSILIVAYLDLPSVYNLFEFKIIWWLSCFAFFINLTRELLKDIEDVKGDYALNMNTLPILLGRGRAKKIATIICVVPIIFLLIIVVNFASVYKITMLYLVLFSILPLLYVSIKITQVKSKKAIHKLSTLLKIIMFLGINSLLILSIIA